MEALEYNMKVWTLNQLYDKIKNCRVVKPPYEEESWNYSEEFFLDKRYWLTDFSHKTNAVIFDKTEIWWIEYFLYQYSWETFIWYDNWGTLVPVTDWVDHDENTPIKIVRGRTAKWDPVSTDVSISSVTAWIWDAAFTWDLEWYVWWYVKFQTSPVPVQWQYLVFTNWILKWSTNKVQLVEDWYSFVIWTNARWSIPANWDLVNIYNETWVWILVAHRQWVALYILDWTNQASRIDVLTTDKSVIDLVNHDWNIFALTEDHMYFSRSTFDDNTQFYELDTFSIDVWYKLFSLWKALLVFWRTNKLFAGATWTTTTLWYVWYDVNYNWNLFSKYSCIFNDQTINILQDDRQLMKVSLVQNNQTTYELDVQNVMWATRWLFENLNSWEIFVTASDKYINYLHINWSDTINYQYDKQLNHWLINEYINKNIYYFWKKILSNQYIYTEEWETDSWIVFWQEVNFSLQWWMYMYMPYVIRTIFGIAWMTTPLDLILDLQLEIWGRIIDYRSVLNNYNFDNRLSETLTMDELIGDDTVPKEQVTYDWTVVSIQNWIYMTWRFLRFKYHSDNRFIIWQSFIFTEKTKPLINEFYNTN
jgi:hypothetical protein